ncbi:Aste57867_10833 [Aphanomyces stellatus]|uniref:Aste57867_10833 protein n=1 Tax=Aphanomyces stellatus TaxID=120398 RepID=A0A485KRF3_9STRA|nr:hypothetical protein As57867_010793 [Aphanomyces stellatus]VFT87701.1 Aste57867_10833 [Aphanomyces stellatus]
MLPSCHHCRKENARCRCGQCRAVYFCNRDCQIQAWPTHRPECVPHKQHPNVSQTPPPAPPAVKRDEVSQSNNAHAPYRCQPPPERTHTTEEAATEKSSEIETTSDGPTKKNKKKKKAKKTTEATSPSNNDTETSSSDVNTVVRPTERPKPKPKQPVDDWEPIVQNVSKKAKKKGKSGEGDKKQRSESMPGSAKNSAVSTKTKSKSLCSKGVSWGSVSAREFARCPGGGSAVPDEGSWALGLGKVVQDVNFGLVDQVETQKEKFESEKHLHLSNNHSHHGHHHHQAPKKEHKVGERMHRMTERERKEVLIQAEESHLHDEHEAPTVQHHGRRRRSSSEECDAHLFATICHEQANEFALIRSSREEMCGCSCGDLVKKVSKMHIKKLVSWLHERNVDTSGKNKTELMQMAKSLAAVEKNCATEDCECARNGVPCHQDVCSGCRDSCHNERYMYKRDEVSRYRKALLARWKKEDNNAVLVATPTISVC